MEIGCFHRVADGFAGRIRTLALDVPIRIVPTGFVDHGRAPDWRLHVEDESRPDALGVEIGSGWGKQRAAIGDYMSVKIDCPSFTRPVRATLLPSRNDDELVLLWSPRMRRPTAE